MLAFAAALVWLAPLAAARAATPTIDLSRLYRNDIRALGMGNSYVAVARGEGALQYNPAGLAQGENAIKLEYSGLLTGTGVTFLQDASKVLGASALTLTEINHFLATYQDTTQRYTGQTFLSALAGVGALNFGVGYGSQDILEYSFAFNGNGTPNVQTDDSITWGANTLTVQYLSGAFAFRDGQMMLGATSKSFRYVAQSTTVTATDLVSGLQQSALTGTTYRGTTLDVGFMYRVEAWSRLRGQWALAVLNTGGATIGSGASKLSVPMSYNFGMSISPQLPVGELLLHFELEDVDAKVLVNNPSGTGQGVRNVIQRSHYGLEYGIWETAFGNHVLNFRTGYNRGLVTWGVEVNFFSGFRMAIANYRDDLGNDSANLYTDPITAFQLSIGFAF